MIRRDSVQAIHGLPLLVFMWKMELGRPMTRPDSFIVIAKGSHSFAFVALMCRVVRLFPLHIDTGLFTVFKHKTSDIVMVCFVHTWMALTIL
jgi:hypothetical protein